MPSKPNRLAREKSPYLLKHSNNPVDWYPWGTEALAKAKNDNKPVFLSIGYSTCHWCTTMEHESFEDEKTAAFINRHFIPVKVDREERPEVDAYYMAAVQVMTGGGGWPLSVFLTPDLKAFYGGTYFPPEPRYGMPSFMQVLEFVANLWKERRRDVLENSERVLQTIEPKAKPSDSAPGKSALEEGYSTLIATFDQEHGGFGAAPKFPLPGSMSFLLRYHQRSGKELPVSAVLKTLDEMAAGGIRDHLGGGFHRYSTDRVWLVPHFEKMLYDNALLAKLYSEAYQLTGRRAYANVVRETIGWMTRELKDEGGGFHSAQEADTSAGEGTYYTWTPEEVERTLGKDKGAVFCRLYGVTRTGNFDGRSILRLDPGAEPDEGTQNVMTEAKEALYLERLKRPRPANDTKVMTSWNGLAISALAFSSMVLAEPDYARTARAAADFILSKVSEGGRLFRRYAGGEAGLQGTLEDYAFFVQGLIDLFEATPEPRWLSEAVRLTGIMFENFEDKENGGFYLTTEAVPAKLKESYDGPTPSGNSVAALNLLRLAELTGDTKFRGAAERTLRAFGSELDQRPSAHTTMLAALDLLLNGARAIVITAPSLRSASEMKAEAFRRYIPDKVVLTATRETYGELSKLSLLLEGRKPGSKAKAFVCENFTCRLPVDTTKALGEQLTTQRG